MKALKHKSIEFSEVLLSELGQEMRFDSEYWEPAYLRNENLLKSKTHTQTKQLAPNPQYGISIAMNETGNGYSILKMDNIMDVLAEDKDAKYADISTKLFKQFQLNQFDVLFNRVNSDEFVGRTGIYLLDGEHTFASYLVKVDTKKPHTNCYLTAFLNCKYGKASLQRVKRRAVNQANINAKELSNLTIPLPSESFQKEIQKLIVEAQKQKVLSEKLYREAEEILLEELGLLNWKPKTTSFKYYGVKFDVEDTVSSIKLSEILKTDSRIDSEYWESHYSEIVKKIKSYNNFDFVKNLCSIHENLTTPEKSKIHKYIELANIGNNGVIEGYIEDYGKNLPTRARRLVQTNQVIISSIEGSLSSCALIPQELDNSFCSTGFYVISSDKINSETLLVLFKSAPFQALMKKACSGTILTAISRRFFKELLIPVVEKSIQKKIKDKITKSFSSKAKNKTLLETAKQAVDIFIETDEKKALNFLKSSIN
jgi:type I restriction enzyme S subunit